MEFVRVAPHCRAGIDDYKGAGEWHVMGREYRHTRVRVDMSLPYLGS